MDSEGVAPSDPLGREVAFGPTGAMYQHDGILVDTDGSLKDEGNMDAISEPGGSKFV